MLSQKPLVICSGGGLLFGSRARGDGKTYRDWDIFIVADGVPENPIDREILLHDLLFKKGIRGVSPILRTREEFEKNLRPLYLDIAWDGIILFDRNAYVASKIEAILGIIEKAGLGRNKKKGDWVWEWKNPPEHGKWQIEWNR
jgi:uncharacterized protein